MNPDDRWMANIRGVRPEYSEYLWGGLGETLILFSLFGDYAPSVVGAKARVDGIVRRLLEQADRERWWSLSREFQLLAEAAPDTFLAMLEEGLEGDAPVTVLFGEDGGPFGGEHVSNLLWALEALAWSPRYLGGVCGVLAKLAARDPGGRYGNRPRNSLRDIFLLWLPQTFATLDSRFRVLDRLRRTEPDVAWQLMLDILPKGYDTASPSSRTKWRDLSVDLQEEVTYALIAKGAQGIAERLLADAGTAASRWTSLIQAFPNLAPEYGAEAIRRLSEAAPGMNDYQRVTISESLRELLNHHRTAPDANWALPGDVLDAIDPVYLALEPRDPIKKVSWLFSSNVRLPRPAAKMKGDSDIDIGPALRADNEEIAKQRRAAVAELLAAGGVDALFSLAAAVEMPALVGVAVADAKECASQQDAILVRALTGSSQIDAALAHGIIDTVFRHEGNAWASALLARGVSEKWGGEALYRILFALPQSRWTWEQAESLGEEIDNLYWDKRYFHWIEGGPDELRFAVEKLLRVHRAAHAIELIGRALDEHLPQDLVLRTLAQAAQEPWSGSENRDLGSFRHSVVRLFKKLDAAGDVPDTQMATLEWAFLPLFRFSERPALALQRVLSSTPKFFVDVVRAVYRPSKESGVEEPPPPNAEQAQNIASQAYNLLQDWQRMPGLTDAGTVDAAALEAWVKEARMLCAQAGRTSAGDNHIGQILAAAPPEPDGVWPAIAVREVIEIARSRDLERGILAGVHNRRGPTWRNMQAGGLPERERAKLYRRCAAETALEWPRTAAILEVIAESYEQHGQWHDQDAERRDWQ